MWDQGSSPYLGDTLHQPPLVLALFYPLVTEPLVENLQAQSLVFIGLDILCALLLRAVAIEYLASPEADPGCGLLGKHAGFLQSVADDEQRTPPKNDISAPLGAPEPNLDAVAEPAAAAAATDPLPPPAYVFDALPHALRARGDAGWLPDAAALAYLLNPLAALCCAGSSIAAVEHLAFLAALLFALRGRTDRCGARKFVAGRVVARAAARLLARPTGRLLQLPPMVRSRWATAAADSTRQG